jgi:hypothetical protein
MQSAVGVNVSYFGFLSILNGRRCLLIVRDWYNRDGENTTKFDIRVKK